MIKVLQIGMTDNLGGIESYLINYYRNIDKSKIQSDFINIYPNNLCFQDEIESMGAKVYRLSSYYKHPFKYLKELVRLIKKNKYNIVHCNMNSAVMLYPLIAAKIAGVKCIIAHSHNASSDKGFLKSFLHFVNKHFIPLFANYYFACSLKAGEWFYSKKIINSSRFKIIYNAIDIDKYKFNNDKRLNKRHELDISDDELLIGHVGRFNKQKNHVFLIDLFYELQKKNPNSKLVLVGIGPNFDLIKNKVEKLGIKDKVLFLGQRNDVNELMMAFDIFILPSLYEGLPLVGVEAQTSGVPCLFSDTITNEVIINDNNKMLSLNDNFDLWIENIMNLYNMKVDRVKSCDSATNFEINNNSNFLMNEYTKISKIKICHFVNALQNGGVEKVIINYFSHMDNIDDYDLHVITQGESDSNCVQEFQNLGFTIHTVTKKSVSLIKNYLDIMKILKDEKFDIVHCHMTTTNCFPLFYSKLAGVKVRISHSHLNTPNISITEKIYIFLTRLFSQYKFSCGIGAANFLYGSNKNVNIINNAIDVSKFSFDLEKRNKVRKKLGFSDNRIIIGHVGRFTEQKNHEFIIDLFNAISEDSDQFELCLIGTGELEDTIKNKVIELGLEDSVKFLGQRNDVNEIMQAFDIFILPSLYEGLPIVGVEAQASGLKCFVSDTIHNEIKVTNNIEFLPLNIDLWKSNIIKHSNYVRKNCIDLVKKNNFEIISEANKLDKIYKKLLSSFYKS